MRVLLSSVLVFFLSAGLSFSAEGFYPNVINYEGVKYVVPGEPYDEYFSNYTADVDGDGEEELIVRVIGDDEAYMIHNAFTLVYDIKGGEKVLAALFQNGEIPTRTEIKDVDKDGVADIIAYGNSGNHCTSVAIYRYSGGRYEEIFSNATPCFLFEVDTEKDKTMITVGRENWDNEDFCYGNSDELSLKEVYVWNGEEFEYAPDMSNVEAVGIEENILKTLGKFMSIGVLSEETDVDKAAAMKVIIAWVYGRKMVGLSDVLFKKSFELLYGSLMKAKEENDIEKCKVLFAACFSCAVLAGNDESVRKVENLADGILKTDTASLNFGDISDNLMQFLFTVLYRECWSRNELISKDEKAYIFLDNIGKYRFILKVVPHIERVKITPEEGDDKYLYLFNFNFSKSDTLSLYEISESGEEKELDIDTGYKGENFIFFSPVEWEGAGDELAFLRCKLEGGDIYMYVDIYRRTGNGRFELAGSFKGERNNFVVPVGGSKIGMFKDVNDKKTYIYKDGKFDRI